MHPGLVTASYIIATVLFILALGGLSNEEKAKRAVWFGIIGMALAVFATIAAPGVGGLWLTSNRGVMRVRRSDIDAVFAGRAKTLSPDHFSEADGLASAQCNGGAGPSALLDQAGKVWIATAGGAAVVDPKALDRYHRQVPPVVIWFVRIS